MLKVGTASAASKEGPARSMHECKAELYGTYANLVDEGVASWTHLRSAGSQD